MENRYEETIYKYEETIYKYEGLIWKDRTAANISVFAVLRNIT